MKIEKGKRYRVLVDCDNHFKKGDIVVALQESYAPMCVAVEDFTEESLEKPYGSLKHFPLSHYELEEINVSRKEEDMLKVMIMEDGRTAEISDEKEITICQSDFHRIALETMEVTIPKDRCDLSFAFSVVVGQLERELFCKVEK